jgi:hypothetical protein
VQDKYAKLRKLKYGIIFDIIKKGKKGEKSLIFDCWCFNVTFSNISVVSWRPFFLGGSMS